MRLDPAKAPMPTVRSVAVLPALAAGLVCKNTFRGAGQDIEETGQAVEDVAEQ
jgi:predicted small secreted protein